MMIRHSSHSIATAACFGLFAAAFLTLPAQAADAIAGKLVAARWCSSCHTTSAAKGGDVAPPFEQLATRAGFNPDALRGFLANPHPPMKSLDLTRIEIDNLVAYLETLRPK